MSRTDGILRIAIAIGIGILWYTGVISGTLLIVLGVVAVAFIATGFINFCPIYAAFRLRTRPKSN